MKALPPYIPQHLDPKAQIIPSPRHKMALAQLNAPDKQENFIDKLTQLNNRTAFNIILEKVWRHCSWERYPISLLRIDIDDFQVFKNTHGSLAGNLLVQHIATVLTDCLNRSENFIARLGENQFAVLLPHTRQAGGQKIGEQILSLVRQLPYLPTQERQHASVSIGLLTVSSGRSASGKPAQHLLEVAEHALYWAKEQGQDQLVTAKAIGRWKRRRKRHWVNNLAHLLYQVE
ncbi:MAG: GGDEF domain-containing protein [Leptolyngbyaceae cyanobacterium MO_188.B28]|nr:GGDEF domain-containing protein [Leptolyngbyaceae cyanobacterium MO_188.B28]